MRGIGREDVKILVVCQHYWPEPYPLSDACEELARRGHSVHVITGVPNYPMGLIYPEYTRGRNREQQRAGVRITRTFTIGRRNNVFFRLLNYVSFTLSSTRYARRLKEEYDIVFTNQTSPVLMSSAALAYGKKHGARVVLYCMDLWPASLAAGGIRRGSVIYRIFEKISARIYRGADRILISSESFRDYLKQEFGIPEDRIRYHPQYTEISFRAPRPAAPKTTVDLMFAGNVGAAQSIPTVLKAARLLEERRELRWHILGDGSELERCRDLAKKLGLANVIFYGRKDPSEMPEYFAMADAMLLTLTADPLISLTLPGKAQAYLAAGKPIIGAADGEIPAMIRKSGCGFCAGAEDEAGLARAVLAFLDCPDKARLGENGRRYYEAHFSRARFMDRLEAELTAQAEQEKAERLAAPQTEAALPLCQ